jgi:CAAX protease family protein
MLRKDNLLAGAAALSFFPLFLLGGSGRFDFWWGMSSAVALVAGLSIVLDKPYLKILADDGSSRLPRKVLLGVFTAVLLYAAFAGLNSLSRFVFPWAAVDIGRVYAFKTGAQPARVGLLILLIIGPGEEIIWRGFLQRHWEKRFGYPAGWLLAAALYAAVHLGSGNAMLILAAGAAGLFWGFLYHRFGSVFLNAVSHTLWDMLIFMIFPLLS